MNRSPSISTRPQTISGRMSFNRAGFFDADALAQIIEQWIALCIRYFPLAHPRFSFTGGRDYTTSAEKVLADGLTNKIGKRLSHLETIHVFDYRNSLPENDDNFDPGTTYILFSLKLDFGQKPWMRSPSLSFTFRTQDFTTDERHAIQDAVVNWTIECFQLLPGLTGQIDSHTYTSLVLPEHIRYPHEDMMVANLWFFEQDRIKSGYFNWENHARHWLRSLSWGMFLTSEHLKRLENLAHVLIKLHEFGAKVIAVPTPFSQSSSLGKWYIQLTSFVESITREDFARFYQLFEPILPEKIASSDEELNRYFEKISQEMDTYTLTESSAISTRAQPETMPTLEDITSVSVPVVSGHMSTIDLSELDQLACVFTGILSQEQQAQMEAVYNQWAAAAFEAYGDYDNESLFVTKYATEPTFFEEMWPTEDLLKAVDLAEVTISADHITTMTMMVELGYGGATSLRHFAVTMAGAAQLVGIKLALVGFGLTDDESPLELVP